MADERTYGDDEVKEIFDLAVAENDAERPSIGGPGGLTLAEIKEVGLEVGMDPNRIVEAAQILDTRHDSCPRRTSLGLPISVGRIIELPRAVTDHEWDILVSDFRKTFGTRGRVRTHGGIREWTHGTLQAFLEPTEAGHRLRLQTRQVGAQSLNRVGAFGLVLAVSLITIFLTTGQSPVFLELALIASFIVGGATLLPNVLRLPRWAREREGQLEDIAIRVRALIGESPEEEEPRSRPRIGPGR